MAAFPKVKFLAKRNKRANKGRKPAKGKPKSQFKRSRMKSL